jgi:hypothetical protein
MRLIGRGDIVRPIALAAISFLLTGVMLLGHVEPAGLI